jgi:hypothetical protein
MSKTLFAAGCLSLFTTAVHVFLGGPEIHEPLLASDASELVRAVGSVVWHAITAILFLNSLALFHAARNPIVARPLAALICVQYVAFTVLFIGYGLARFGSVFVMPQWTGFLVMSLLALWSMTHSSPPKGNETLAARA